MSLDLDRILRRLKPEKHTTRLSARPAAVERPAGRQVLVLDTTVYVHAGQGRLPAFVAAMLRDRRVFNCSVAMGEIGHAIGHLDPAHPRTSAHRRYFEDVLRGIPAHRIVTPDATIHVEAGIVVGMLARLQGLSGGAHRSKVNDALILLTARREGAAVLTANRSDFDLLQQLVPAAGVIFYETSA